MPLAKSLIKLFGSYEAQALVNDCVFLDISDYDMIAMII
jgi:hypothetical protein